MMEIPIYGAIPAKCPLRAFSELAAKNHFRKQCQFSISCFFSTMSIEETKAAFERTATHDSRNVLRDCLGPTGEVDLDRPHAPLLFIGGDMDENHSLRPQRPYSEPALSPTWTVTSGKMEIRLNVSIGHTRNWQPFLTITTSDGFSEMFFDDGQSFLPHGCLIAQIKRIKNLL